MAIPTVYDPNKMMSVAKISGSKSPTVAPTPITATATTTAKPTSVAATPKTAAEYASELGRSQQAYQQYGTAGRTDLQKGASTYADQLRAAAKAAGVDLSSYGTANKNGIDYTKNYTGATAGAYDPTKTGQVVAQNDTQAAPIDTGAPKDAVVSNSGSNSNMNLINSMYQNNLESQRQAFEKQRQIQQQGLNGQETSVNQNALQNLNNNDAMASQQLKSLQEVMANNGVRGGDSITATIGNQTAQQNGANSINQDKANQLRSIMEQRSLIDNNAAGDNTALIQKLQATRDGQMLDNSYKQQDYALNLAQLMGKTADGQNTLGGNQLALQQQGQNFNQGMQNKQFDQSVKNDTFNQGMQTKQFDYQKVQDDIKNGQWTTQTENQMKQWAEGNKLNWAQFNQQTKQALAQIAISQQNANTNAYQASTSAANQANDNALQLKKFNYDTDKNNIDNLYKQSQIDKNTADAQKSGLDDAYYKAVGLAQKDPLFGTYDAAKQSQIINTHYDNLKPKSNGPSDADISQYLNKK